MLTPTPTFVARVIQIICTNMFGVVLLACAHFATATTFNVTVGPGGALQFSPATVTIQAGDTVTWTWGSSGHSSTSGTCVGTTCTPDGTWDSGTLNVGATFSHTFLTAGTFAYFCIPHTCCNMKGTVIVTGGTPTPTPTPTATPSLTNTFYGDGAGANTSTGVNDSGFGASALFSNNTGISNTAAGFQALYANTLGNYNTAVGQGALSANLSGNNNTAIGQNALPRQTSGRDNIAIGSNAGYYLTTGSNNIDIGNRGVAGESNTIRIGKNATITSTYIAGIDGATVAEGVNVVVDSSGHLGTVTSSARYKKNIKPMDDASYKILALRPVTFQYKDELDPHGIPQFGLVAEEVAKVDPDLVAKDESGQAYTVRYDAVNAMLLNEFIKEHKKVEEQQREIGELRAAVSQLQASIPGANHARPASPLKSFSPVEPKN